MVNSGVADFSMKHNVENLDGLLNISRSQARVDKVRVLNDFCREIDEIAKIAKNKNDGLDSFNRFIGDCMKVCVLIVDLKKSYATRGGRNYRKTFLSKITGLGIDDRLVNLFAKVGVILTKNSGRFGPLFDRAYSDSIKAIFLIVDRYKNLFIINSEVSRKFDDAFDCVFNIIDGIHKVDYVIKQKLSVENRYFLVAEVLKGVLQPLCNSVGFNKVSKINYQLLKSHIITEKRRDSNSLFNEMKRGSSVLSFFIDPNHKDIDINDENNQELLKKSGVSSELTPYGRFLFCYYRINGLSKVNRGIFKYYGIEDIFKQFVGLSSLDFFRIATGECINSDSISHISVFPRSIKKVKCGSVVTRNDDQVVEFDYKNSDKGFISKTTIQGHNTFSVKSHGIGGHDKVFANNNQYQGFYGVNHNTVKLDVTANGNSKVYELETIGSYQAHNQDVVGNAKQLIKNITQKKDLSTVKEHFIIDFKPLKGMFNDLKIFDTHSKVMNDATDSLVKDGNSHYSMIRYIPVWGNSYGGFGSNILTSVPSGFDISKLSDICNFFNGNKNQLDSNEQSLLNRLGTIIGNVDNFKLREKFIEAMTIIRILALKFPNNFTLICGCMSAKDRAGAVVATSNLIIQLYLMHNSNLDLVLDDKGFVLPNLESDDSVADFIKAMANTPGLYNSLSYFAIGYFNNKNSDLLLSVFAKTPKFKKLLLWPKLVKTSA